MNRVRLTFAAALLGASFAASAALAQTPQAPPMTSVLAGKKFTPPIKGAAEVELTKPVTRKEKEMVVTKIQVKNVSNGPIARLTVDESWYDKSGALVAGGKGVVNGLLQPGEIQTITIETPYNSKMSANQWVFSHANGTVPKPKRVDKMTAGDSKEPAAKTASASKTSTSKSSASKSTKK
jgi:hypothetical protein